MTTKRRKSENGNTNRKENRLTMGKKVKIEQQTKCQINENQSTNKNPVYPTQQICHNHSFKSYSPDVKTIILKEPSVILFQSSGPSKFS
jgi:hypothetical protein